MEQPYAIEMLNITKRFPGIVANDNITLQLKRGEIHALLGENGAGKSTLMSVLFGLYQPEEGVIKKDGQVVQIKDPNDANALGIGMVHQHFKLVECFSILDNIILGVEPCKNGFLQKQEAREKVLALSEKYGLKVDLDARVENITVGMQQRVEILKALYRDVELLILDEPTGVLTPQETAQFFEVLRALQKEGYGIIIITHRMSEIMAISDRVTILRDGKKVAQLVTAETQPDELSRHMIGRELNESYDVDTPPGEETLLSLEAISLPRKKKGHPLHDITLELRRGEILGVAGVEGNGQKELAEIITGIQHPSQGRVVLDGQEIQRENVRQRYERGVVYISDDRLNDSLVTDMDMTENLMLRDYCRAPFSHKGLLDRKAMLQTAKEKIQRYQVRSSGTSGEATPVRLLSGGNQQKLIVAREIHDRAQVVVASQPTRGLDVGAIEYIHSQIVAERDKGKAVLLVSLELDEVMNLSDRILVMYEGEIVGEFDPKTTTVQELGLYMAGARKQGKETK